jgi:hypothetical protein
MLTFELILFSVFELDEWHPIKMTRNAIKK